MVAALVSEAILEVVMVVAAENLSEGMLPYNKALNFARFAGRTFKTAARFFGRSCRALSGRKN